MYVPFSAIISLHAVLEVSLSKFSSRLRTFIISLLRGGLNAATFTRFPCGI